MSHSFAATEERGTIVSYVEDRKKGFLVPPVATRLISVPAAASGVVFGVGHRQQESAREKQETATAEEVTGRIVALRQPPRAAAARSRTHRHHSSKPPQ